MTQSSAPSSEGRLRMNNGGRWEIHYPGDPDRGPYELTSGEVFRVEVAGRDKLSLTRMAFNHNRAEGGDYYSVDGYPLFEGARAAPGSGE